MVFTIGSFFAGVAGMFKRAIPEKVSSFFSEWALVILARVVNCNAVLQQRLSPRHVISCNLPSARFRLGFFLIFAAAFLKLCIVVMALRLLHRLHVLNFIRLRIPVFLCSRWIRWVVGTFFLSTWWSLLGFGHLAMECQLRTVHMSGRGHPEDRMMRWLPCFLGFPLLSSKRCSMICRHLFEA